MKTIIDAVITWVDGEDPEHKEKINKYRPSKLTNDGYIGLQSERFHNNNEIEVCIKSIKKFASWVDTIYLVTDNQKPIFLTDRFKEKNKIVIIDHQVLFSKKYKRYLPVFNSRSIETLLYKIPGLSENFIYFNDDMFLTSKTLPSDFFYRGVPLIKSRKSYTNKYLNKLVNLFRKLINTKYSRGYIRREYPIKLKYVHEIAHAPYPIIKSSFKKNMMSFDLDNQLRYRFRNEMQIWPIGYYYNNILNNGQGIQRDSSWGYISNASTDKELNYLLYRFKLGKIKTMCVQSIEKLNDKQLSVYKKIASSFTVV